MTDSGMAPMTARLVGALFISDSGRLTAAELVQHLHVSPATISHAIRWQEQRELVSRERESSRVRLRRRRLVPRMDDQNPVHGPVGRHRPAGRRDLQHRHTDRLHLTSQFFEHLSRETTRPAELWRYTLALQRRG